MFRVLSVLLIALLLGGATNPPQKVEAARAAFKALPLQERLDIQSLLTVNGYWSAVANDSFGPKLMNAIQEFQGSNGFEPTGILTPEQRSALREKASPLLRKWNLAPVRHPSAPATLWVPKGLNLSTERSRRGLEFEAEADALMMSFLSFSDGDLEAAFRVVKADVLKNPSMRLEYEVLKDDFFVISSGGGGVSTYTRFQTLGDGIVGFVVSWGTDSPVRGERLVVLISDLFRASVSLKQSRRPPEPIEIASPDKSLRFIVIASRTEPAEAVVVAKEHHAQLSKVTAGAGLGASFEDIFVARFSNGRYAVVLGPIQAAKAAEMRDAFREARLIPDDSFVSDGSKLLDVVWTAPQNAGSTVATAPSPAPSKPKEPEISTGSGFFISEDGFMLTNAHVAGECRKITVPPYGPATLVRKDTTNDLAMIRISEGKPKAVATFQDTPVRAGASVFVVGYPLSQYLGGAFNITAGMVSSLSGLDGDTRYFQFTAPLQPGNSGGPVLDATGKVVGIATAKLSDMNMLKVAGTVPQNVNFAIGTGAFQAFIRATGVPVKTEAGGDAVKPEDIAGAGAKFSAQIICEE